MISAIEILVVLCAASVSGVVAWRWIRSPRPLLAEQCQSEDGICYLFDGDDLHHATDAAGDFLPLVPGDHAWFDLYDAVIDRFVQFPLTPKTTGAGETTLSAVDSDTPNRVVIAWQDGKSRVTFTDTPEPEGPVRNIDRSIVQRLDTSLTVPVWHTNTDGRMMWRNAAYQRLCEAAHPEDTAKEPLFDLPAQEVSKRLPLRLSEGGKTDWFEVTRTELDGILCHQAICISALIHAEEAQRNFVQTLTKTFAQLSIGLAIFDRNSQLALFNPALVDLTGLKAEFLSARPAVQTFFDRLRETRKMPEPKSYINWRNAITDMIRAAKDGRYEEVWSLDNGQTFRVKGRPHPDGATAFLVEDITAEISLTRTFRAELELGQSMLDTLEDAIAVFSASGVLTFSNLAYQKLWNVAPNISFADVTIYDAIQHWKCKSAPNPMWPQIEDFVRNFGDRKPWSMPLYLGNGAELTCLISPIVSGATLIRFDVGKKAIGTAPVSEPEPVDLGD